MPLFVIVANNQSMSRAAEKTQQRDAEKTHNPLRHSNPPIFVAL
jgi:hypothetical protein